MRKVLLNLVLALLSCLLTLLIIEIILRLVDKPDWTQHFRVGWKYHGDDLHVNQIGYRGQQIHYSDNDIVVVLLGDSQVEARACPFDSLPEQLLQKHLNRIDPRYKVFSLGSLGYGNDQELLALQEYFREFRADKVVLWQTFNNDVWNNMFPTNMPKDGNMKPTFRLEDGQLVGPNYNFLDTIMSPPTTKLELVWQRITHPQNGLDDSWEIYLPPPYQPLNDFDGHYKTDWDPKLNLIRKNENLNNEKSHFSVYLTPQSQRTRYGLDLTRGLLKKINELCTKNHCKFILFHTDQDMIMTELSVTQKVKNVYYQASVDQFQANLNYTNQDVESITIPILNHNWWVSDKDKHLNCPTNHQVMGLLADSLTRHIQD